MSTEKSTEKVIQVFALQTTPSQVAVSLPPRAEVLPTILMRGGVPYIAALVERDSWREPYEAHLFYIITDGALTVYDVRASMFLGTYHLDYVPGVTYYVFQRAPRDEIERDEITRTQNSATFLDESDATDTSGEEIE